MRNITIISGTNRPGSYTQKVANDYKTALEQKGHEVRMFSLTELPQNIIKEELYGKRSVGFDQLVKDNIENSQNFLFVVPEYNGSFPGILKVFIDAVHPSKWNEKNACLVGV